jgi:hypothetical protein
MNGIYLTLEGKQEIESKIAELEIKRDEAAKNGDEVYANSCIGQIFAYYEVLSSATILPVEESWDSIMIKALKHESDNGMEQLCPQGVVIQPKQ